MAVAVVPGSRLRISTEGVVYGSAFSPMGITQTSSSIQIPVKKKCPSPKPGKDCKRIFIECVCPNSLKNGECQNGESCLYLPVDVLQRTKNFSKKYKQIRCKYDARCKFIPMCNYKHTAETYHQHDLSLSHSLAPTIFASKLLVEVKYAGKTIRWLDALPKGCTFTADDNKNGISNSIQVLSGLLN